MIGLHSQSRLICFVFYFHITITVDVKGERENFWINGAIQPLTGKHFQQEYLKLNGDCFQQFLDWLSQQLAGAWSILQIDQAPAHTSCGINWPENIISLL